MVPYHKNKKNNMCFFISRLCRIIWMAICCQYLTTLFPDMLRYASHKGDLGHRHRGGGVNGFEQPPLPPLEFKIARLLYNIKSHKKAGDRPPPLPQSGYGPASWIRCAQFMYIGYTMSMFLTGGDCPVSCSPVACQWQTGLASTVSWYPFAKVVWFNHLQFC